MSQKVVQLDMFINNQLMAQNLKQAEFEKMCVRSLRSLFARYNEMEMTVMELHKKLDRLSEIQFTIDEKTP